MAELHLYEVQHRGHTATLKLSEEEAERLYPDAKKLGKAHQGEPQPVTRPPYATDDSASDPADRENLVTSRDAKQAEAPQNKARQTNQTSRRG